MRWATPRLLDAGELETMLDCRLVGPLPDISRLLNFAAIIKQCIQVRVDFLIMPLVFIPLYIIVDVMPSFLSYAA